MTTIATTTQKTAHIFTVQMMWTICVGFCHFVFNYYLWPQRWFDTCMNIIVYLHQMEDRTFRRDWICAFDSADIASFDCMISVCMNRNSSWIMSKNLKYWKMACMENVLVRRSWFCVKSDLCLLFAYSLVWCNLVAWREAISNSFEVIQCYNFKRIYGNSVACVLYACMHTIYVIHDWFFGFSLNLLERDL